LVSVFGALSCAFANFVSLFVAFADVPLDSVAGAPFVFTVAPFAWVPVTFTVAPFAWAPVGFMVEPFEADPLKVAPFGAPPFGA
jgi:hypothetical protein